MQVRVTGLRVAPGELEELTNTYQTSILPELRHQQGFSSLLLLSDAETGRVLELTLFEDEDARRESEEQGGYAGLEAGYLNTGVQRGTSPRELRPEDPFLSLTPAFCVPSNRS
jgi:hypothetical protein